ncbi:hypothetical protein BDN72DRAFT_622071 [Pluteus cervinus]|uniref:Uncharacterized protein n=1 Tax=Pluteus cervinus TaxID=181527 RepID=A0ACD3AWB9_9AGAR|nr:hypothetical protein BDN72DRAFT_622071 [Pluteus cervinus]
MLWSNGSWLFDARAMPTSTILRYISGPLSFWEDGLGSSGVFCSRFWTAQITISHPNNHSFCAGAYRLLGKEWLRCSKRFVAFSGIGVSGVAWRRVSGWKGIGVTQS